MRLRGHQLDGFNAALKSGDAAKAHQELQTACARAEGLVPFASASGSLPASSVKVLLDRWTQYRDDWRQSEADWKNNQTSESDAVRLNRCQARAKVLEQVIEELRAEVAAANVRQPEENS